jgi:hypothetical protein
MGKLQLKKTYYRDGIVLVLGAGVSVGSEIPTWVNLLRGMVMKTFDGDETMFDQLREQGLSLTAIASLLEERSPSREEFVEAVRDALYVNFPFYRIGTKKENRGRFLRYVHEGIREDANGIISRIKPNTTLRSVGAFCTTWKQPKKRESGFHRNPKVHAAATLNMDALLQSYISALTTKRLIRTVERPSARKYPDRINIYHMHGYLHFETLKKDGEGEISDEEMQAREAADAVVLTEQDYYDFFNQPNSMFNYTFLYLLREYSCLFIGLSMDDENIRRLLHYSKLERTRALEKKLGASASREKLREMTLRHFAILPRSGVREVDRAQQDTLRPLGVSVLRVDQEFKQLPQVLGDVYNYQPKKDKSKEDKLKEKEDKWSRVYRVSKN